MDTIFHLLLGSLRLRPYVFAFLAVYLVAAIAEWGVRRALGFVPLAGGLAFVAEWSSTRVGLPFGVYHYTGETRGQELYLGNVPFFDPLSFSFLAYASLGVARLVLRGWGGWGRRWRPGPRERPALLALTSGILMTWLDLVIDPLAVRGDRWFLGRIFYYPEPGVFFGVPLANFAGWTILGATIAAVWHVVGDRIGGRPPRWARALPARRYHALVLYYAVLLFNLGLTAAVAEAALFWTGVVLHLPLAGLVVSCVRAGGRDRAGAFPPGQT
jgi:putative membrane protein